jgi:uncharacterized membrane protein SirB2
VEYFALKQIHLICVALSYSGFFLRGIWMIRDSPMLGRRWVRVLPHIIDSILLASAVAMAVMIRQYPFVHAWLTAKVVALAIYIALGMIALGRGRNRPVRIAAWIAAQIVFAYIVLVALKRNPLPWAA